MENFSRRMIELHGTAGEVWLRNLPSLLEDCARRWSLTIHSHFEDLSYNYVAPATGADGVEVVLKLGVPNPELLTEIEALRLQDGRGAVKLLEADPEQGILVLERLNPGAPIVEIPDEEATAIAAEVMGRLWRPVPAEHAFLSVSDWADGMKRLRDEFEGGTGPFPEDLVAAAERLFEELLGSMAEPVVLHGDLHHWNIVSAERQLWLSIDPKGILGEPAYEVGAWLRNPYPQLLQEPHPDRIMARRVDQFAEALGFDRERIIGWGLAQAVLSGWWSYEDHGQAGGNWLIFADLLAGLNK